MNPYVEPGFYRNKLLYTITVERITKPRFMKKLAHIFLSCSVLIMFSLLFIIGSFAVSRVAFHSGHSHRNAGTCTQYYVGMNKGTIWEDGEWHHYVDFNVNDSAPIWRWRVTEAPVESSLWKGYSTSSLIRVAYRWPSNWRDPFPASDWKICRVSS
jgi:hypothetical protein